VWASVTNIETSLPLWIHCKQQLLHIVCLMTEHDSGMTYLPSMSKPACRARMACPSSSQTRQAHRSPSSKLAAWMLCCSWLVLLLWYCDPRYTCHAQSADCMHIMASTFPCDTAECMGDFLFEHGQQVVATLTSKLVTAGAAMHMATCGRQSCLPAAPS